MRTGKLTSAELKNIVLDKIKSRREEVVLSSKLSEDCAAIKCGDIMLVSTDPITAAESNIGSLSVEVSANDIYACGGEPFACLLTVIAPPDATLEEIAAVVDGAIKKADGLNIDIIGGHTEYSDAVNRVITSCTVIGKTDSIIKTAGAAIGDSVLMTKSAGIEGTLILVSDFKNKLNLTEEEIAEVEGYSKLISIGAESRAGKKLLVRSMHDITEGGVFGAVSEMAEAAGVGAEIYVDRIPVTAVTRKVCGKLGLNPYRLISSGSLLMTTDKPDEVIARLKDSGVVCANIGKITEGSVRAIYAKGGEETLYVAPDELLKIERN